MSLAQKSLLGIEWPDIRSRLFDLDFERAGWLRVEEFKENGDIVVRAEMPGIDPDKDVEVSINEGTLQIRAHREEKAEHKGRKSYRSEFRYGAFERDLPLPAGAKDEDVTASYRDGILEVRVKCATEETEAKKVPIEHS